MQNRLFSIDEKREMASEYPNLLILPNEVLVKIAKSLTSVRDLENLSMTCHRLSEICHSPELRTREVIDNAEDLTREIVIKYLKPTTKRLRLNFGCRGSIRAMFTNFVQFMDFLTFAKGPHSGMAQRLSTSDLSLEKLALLEELVPQLEELVLVNCYIPDTIDVMCFPKSIYKLVLVECTLIDYYSSVTRTFQELEGGFLTNLGEQWHTAVPNLQTIKFIRCLDVDGNRFANKLGRQVDRWTTNYAGNWNRFELTEEYPKHRWRGKVIRGVHIILAELMDQQRAQWAQVATVTRFLEHHELVVMQGLEGADDPPPTWQKGARYFRNFMFIYGAIYYFSDYLLWFYDCVLGWW